MSGADVIPYSQTRSSYSGSGWFYWLNVRIHISSGSSSGSAVSKIKHWNRLVTIKTCFLSFWQKWML